MTFVLVLREEGTNGHGLIVRGETPRDVLKRAFKKLLRKPKRARPRVKVDRRKRADTRADPIIKSLYHRVSASEIATILSRDFQKTFTKSQVIGRARDMGLCRKKEDSTNGRFGV